MSSILQATCLSPKKSLRAQLFSSFGSAAFLGLFIVVLSSCLAIHKSGEDVKWISQELMRDQVQQSLLRSSELVAEKYIGRLASVEATIQILVEAVQDRIAGYPSLDGWEDGQHVPFMEHYNYNSSRQKRYKYPLSQPPVPLDWEIKTETRNKFSDYRTSVFEDMLKTSRTASYHMPGSCNVFSETIIKSFGCTDENNNITTGGIFPTKVHEGLYRSSGDLSVFMKALYEADMELVKLQILFFNEGAGTTLQYPGGPIAPLTPMYVSSGCDWITQKSNPYTGRPYGTLGDVAKCRFEGIQVESHNYNSMETGTPQFILENGKLPSKTSISTGEGNSNGVAWQGPLYSSNNSTLILRAGKAVYDRLTDELIGFVVADVWDDLLANVLSTQVLNVSADVCVARYSDGSLLTISQGSDVDVFGRLSEFDEISNALKSQLGIYLDSLKAATEDDSIEIGQPIFIKPMPSGGVYTATLLPVPPTSLEGAESYEPVAVLIQKMPPEVFEVVTSIGSAIDDDVRKTTILSVVLGICGLCVVLLILAVMSTVLTRPLTFVTAVAYSVINYDYNDKAEQKDDDDDSLLTNFDKLYRSALLRCTPKTEVVRVVEEFQIMIQGFSGLGASQVAEPPLFQIRNRLTWHSDFAQFYHPEGHTKKSFRQTSVASDTSRTASENAFNRPVPSTDGSRDHSLNESPDLHQAPSFQSSAVHQIQNDAEDDQEENENDEPVPFQHQEIPHQQPTLIPEDESEHFFATPPPPPEDRQSRVSVSQPKQQLNVSPVVPAPSKVHRSPVLGQSRYSTKPIVQEEDGACKRTKDVCCSSLFWWIVILMACPVVITNVIIGRIVSNSVYGKIPAWTESVELASNSIEEDTLQFVAEGKARNLGTLVAGPMRDLHVMARLANWLIFGGIQRSNMVTHMDSATEECKESISEGVQCPSYTQERMPCLCEWECQEEWSSPFGCQQTPDGIEPRYLQTQNFVVQKLDADLNTGNRKSCPSFPELSNTPATTSWWTNISEFPGSEKGPSNAFGYETLFDRAVVSSACSVFNFPVYNYATSLKREKHFLGGWVAFEDDGLMAGWSGCNHAHVSFSGWSSSFENGATLIDPDLCPNGKFGYDPRCRGWYADGRDKYMNFTSPVHVTGKIDSSVRSCYCFSNIAD
jgi:hypothetical protein